MFGRNDKQKEEPEEKSFFAPSESTETVIGPSVEVIGDFKGDGDILVEGRVKGKLKTKGGLHISQGAQCISSIDAHDAKIAGEVQGNIRVKESLEIESGAIIKGDIEAKTLSVMTGAVINGLITMGEQTKLKEIEIDAKVENKDANI